MHDAAIDLAGVHVGVHRKNVGCYARKHLYGHRHLVEMDKALPTAEIPTKTFDSLWYSRTLCQFVKGRKLVKRLDYLTSFAYAEVHQIVAGLIDVRTVNARPIWWHVSHPLCKGVSAGLSTYREAPNPGIGASFALSTTPADRIGSSPSLEVVRNRRMFKLLEG